MILELYLSLFGLALVLLMIGYYAKIDAIKVLSFGIIFILGAFVLGVGDTVQYKTADLVNQVNITYSTITYQYATYQNTTLGFMFAVLAFFGWLSIYFDYASRRGG